MIVEINPPNGHPTGSYIPGEYVLVQTKVQLGCDNCPNKKEMTISGMAGAACAGALADAKIPYSVKDELWVRDNRPMHIAAADGIRIGGDCPEQSGGACEYKEDLPVVESGLRQKLDRLGIRISVDS